jgi:orotate phosphoribosyltransferase
VSSQHALTELRYTVRCGDPLVVGQMLTTPEALLCGHLALLSGLHTDRFLAFSRIADDPAALRAIASWLAPSLAPVLPDALLAPSTAGVGLGWALARELGVPLHLAVLDSHGRATGLLGAPEVGGRRVVLVNDIVTTGQGLRALAEAASQAGALTVGAGWFASRDEIDMGSILDIPCAWVTDVPLPAWPADGCALCAERAPLQQGLDLN